MTPRYMLDTDVVSYIAKGHPPEFRRQMRALPASQVGVSAITQAEVLYGLLRLPDDHPLQAVTRQFLDSVIIPDWPISGAIHYARVKHYLVSTGQTIGEMDLLIASHSLAIGAMLVTGNTRHHSRVPGLEIIDWRE